MSKAYILPCTEKFMLKWMHCECQFDIPPLVYTAVPQHCLTNCHRLSGLKTTQVYSLRVLEDGNLKSSFH